MILQIVFPALVGGLERVVEALATGLAHRGRTVAVAAIVSSGDEEPELVASLRSAGLETHPIRVRGREYIRERREIRHLCQRLKPQVVHTHGYRPDVIDAGVARALGIPIVSTVHGFTAGHWKNRLYERIDRLALRRFDGVVAVSRSVAERLFHSGVRPDRIHVIPNAWTRGSVALPREVARRELGFVGATGIHVGWVGRFSAEKGPDVLVRSLQLLRDLPVVATMIGSGPQLEHTRSLAAESGVGDRVRFAGSVVDAARVYKAFDVFVLSSRTEGTPVALFEAMSAGVPVVATRVGGVPDVLGDDGALLVDSGDSDALAAAIRSVRDDPEAAAMRVDRARERLAAQYAPGPWLDRHEALYDQIARA